ncbi:MAG: YdcF family protein [Candidatus Nanopelagicales bacterium]
MTAPAILLEWSPARPQQSRRRRTRRRFAALVATVTVTTMVLPIGAAAEVMRWATTDDRTPTDAVVVLGAAQYQGAPSPILANRLAHAHQLVSDGVSDTIITVGGFQFGDITSEAQTGKEELVAEGLRRRQVIAVPFGDDTEESLRNVATIAAQEGLRTVTIVTDPTHMARAHALANAMGLHARVSPTAEGPGTSIGTEQVLRESVGLIGVWLDH